jgi:hypothetical protein
VVLQALLLAAQPLADLAVRWQAQRLVQQQVPSWVLPPHRAAGTILIMDASASGDRVAPQTKKSPQCWGLYCCVGYWRN